MQRAVGEIQSLKISFVNCDCNQEDNTLFDASNPGDDNDDIYFIALQHVAYKNLYLYGPAKTA
jgi:hypothetical protein